MPTITVSISDLSRLLGRDIPSAQWLEDNLMYVKGELKAWNEQEDEAKIELNDTNRPDLWCPEGIVRQIRARLTGTSRRYPFLEDRAYAGVVEVDEELGEYRPYIAAFTASGPAMTDASLRQLIQTQEKLSDTFGRKRKAVATGVYKLERVAFPVRYMLVDPDEKAFVPLGFDEEMTCRQVMEKHPTALEYKAAVDGYDKYPLLVGAKGDVLSMPPIINSRLVGAVEEGDSELFIEVTGVDLRQVILAVNIFAANLADRDYEIKPVMIKYPYETPLGLEVRTPCSLQQVQDVTAREITSALGIDFEASEIEGGLTAYGLSVEPLRENTWRVRPPFYRNDLLHPMDVVEDIAIAQGYHKFEPELPKCFTVGRFTPLETFSDEMRALMVEAGFTEILSPILTHRDKLSKMMRLPGRRIIEIDNVMTENYSVIRDAVLPSLLEVEAASGKAAYPHLIFESGEVAVRNFAQVLGSSTMVNLAAAIFNPDASFSEIHAYLDRLFYFMDLPYRLKAKDHPSAIPGRSGRVIVDERDVGGVGELHPEVLDSWGIRMPCAAFEINLDKLLEALGRTE